ncbi:APC family permease [Allokutzneria sp. A3M-2-11 16]|uniref:APC family permease n=1 Tax=Allokutzneria sp. A3M-2-11 16 TaxID=2962043 RepID=UPI0027E344F8|nr:APC family permease [Allokutzneria sp. A3M-2-11 16]
MAGVSPPSSGSPEAGFERRIGLLQATGINMTQMCGIGPFITIPGMIAAMHGPQAMFGWLIGAIIVLADGLVWAELGAAMPGAGGTYLYLREAFQYRTGRLMPFLFTWTAMLFIPLIMSTGVIGLVTYLGYLVPGLVDADGVTTFAGHAVGIGVVALVVLLLYRRIGEITRLTTVLFGVMLVSVVAVIVSAYSNWHPELAFAFTPGAFSLDGGPFWLGLGAGLMIAIYDYLGYNTSAYLGAEIRDPGRTIPRSIVLSIVGMMSLYFVLQVGILGVLPWEEAAKPGPIASTIVEHNWGVTAAQILTALVVVTAFASVFAGLLGGSRVPYNAAKDGVFLPWFGKLHPRLHFPHVGLLAMGVVTAVGSLLDLATVIAMLTAVFVLVQSIAQIAALIVLRRRQPDLARPYRQWLYPVPCVVALLGWGFVYFHSGQQEIPGTGINQFMLSLGWVGLGVLAFLVWARREGSWPFGPKEIREEFLGRP